MRQIAPGVMIIGRYEPSKLDAELIGLELLGLTKDHNLINSDYGAWGSATWKDHFATAEVRSPDTRKIIEDNQTAIPWHQDASGKDVGMVLWSNREQTEIMLEDGTVLQPEPNDVILIRNTSVKHRTPPKVSADRWFFRRYVDIPAWFK